jgi:uncharacterized protein YbbK (DUF523 family)
MNSTILISACLLGINCRYDGTAKEAPELKKLLADYRLIPFCPETLGGLTVPRLPSEIQCGDGGQVLSGSARVRDRNGRDLTAEFIAGARMTLALAELHHPMLVVAKAKSPSCGAGQIYDGSFTGKLQHGDGVTIAMLRQAGYTVCSEKDFLENPDQILGEKND